MEKKYLNIPLPMLRGLHINSKEFYDNCFDVGIYLHSKTLEGSEEKRYKDSCDFFKIIQTRRETHIDKAKSILIKLPPPYPVFGFELDILWDFYKNQKEEHEKFILAAFLGIKSILGAKAYCKTNKAHVYARMLGYDSINELPIELTDEQRKYQLRWHMDKLLLQLQLSWHLKVISNRQRGMYISFDLDLEKLAVISEKNKLKNKLSAFQELKAKAIERAKNITAH